MAGAGLERMQKNTVIIINDRLEPFEQVLKALTKASPHRMLVTCLRDPLQGISAGELAQISSMDCLVLVEERIYAEHGQTLNGSLSSLFRGEFRNYLLLRDGTGGERPARVLGADLPVFPLSAAVDPAVQAAYMGMYLDVLMKNATLSERLTRYIADSFQSVVYSELINRKNREIELLNRELEEKNRTDGLTHLYNRNALFDFLEQERKRTMRDLWRLHGSPRGKPSPAAQAALRRVFPNPPRGKIEDHFGVFSVLMIDMDNFKKINDSYGHLAGDEVLKAFGEIFRGQQILRENDIAGRFGGEEFVVILPGTKAVNALEPAERLKESFHAIDFTAPSGQTFKVSFSIGISQFSPKDKSCDEVIERADRALYYAKRHGRDRIVLFENISAAGRKLAPKKKPKAAQKAAKKK